MAKTNNYLNIDARGAIPVIQFYGVFGEGELTPEVFGPKWKALNNPRAVRLEISSPGGSVFAANAIFDLIARSGANITVNIDGLAASMASYVAMLGRRIIIGAGAMMMVHNPAVSVGGGAEDLKRGAALLEAIRVRMVAVYAKRTGLSEETIAKMMDAETWLDADDAIRLGFADEKGADLKLAASAFDLTGFTNTPCIPAPKNMNEVAARYWTGKGKPPAQLPADLDDLSDLVPPPITQAKAFANFHGKHAGRK